MAFINLKNMEQESSMAKMSAAQAAAYVLELEGVTQVFGVPGAAINPFYAALRK